MVEQSNFAKLTCCSVGCVQPLKPSQPIAPVCPDMDFPPRQLPTPYAGLSIETTHSKWHEIIYGLQDLLEAAVREHEREVVSLHEQLQALRGGSGGGEARAADYSSRASSQMASAAAAPGVLAGGYTSMNPSSAHHHSQASQGSLLIHPPDKPTPVAPEMQRFGNSLVPPTQHRHVSQSLSEPAAGTDLPDVGDTDVSMCLSQGVGGSMELSQRGTGSQSLQMPRGSETASPTSIKHKAAIQKARDRATNVYAQLAVKKSKLSVMDVQDEEDDEHRRVEVAIRSYWQGDSPGRFKAPGLLSSTVSLANASPATAARNNHITAESSHSGRSRECSPCLAGLVTHPSSSKRLVWDVMGMVLLMLDSFLIPLQAFSDHYDDGSFAFQVATAVATCYWSSDIVASFLVGFHADGNVEMGLRPIAKHYLSTWFGFDLALVAIDWSFMFGVMQRVSFLRAGKTLSRGFRIMRLARIVKIHAFISSLMERIHSEFTKGMFNIFLLVVFIITLNHFIACGWYALGSSLQASQTWVSYYLSEGESLGYRYTTSLHWSLTQFTPASMEVVPKNAAERTYSVCVLLFALITFSSFVSSITSEMTHIRMLNSRKLDMQSRLRKYLRERNISRKVVSGVWHYLDSKDWKRRATVRTREADVGALDILPPTMRRDLRVAGRAPVLKHNPFFAAYASIEPSAFYLVCDGAVTECSLLTKQELFGSTSAIKEVQMVFVCEGVLDYWLPCSCGTDNDITMEIPEEAAMRQTVSGKVRLAELIKDRLKSKSRRTSYLEDVGSPNGSKRKVSLEEQMQSSVSCRDRVFPDEWACEVSLWATEVELSSPFIAAEISEVLLVDPARFHETITQFKLTAELVASYARAYAREVEQMTDCRWRIAVATNLTKLQELVQQEVILHDGERMTARRSARAHTRSSVLRALGMGGGAHT